MTVAEMERRFYELKGKLDVGAISEEDFKAEIEKLRFQDPQNRWWMIGAQSGKWYFYDGTRWIPGQPEVEPTPSEPPPPEPPIAAEPTPPPARASTAAEEMPAELSPVISPSFQPQPVPLTPLPEHLRRERKPIRMAMPVRMPMRGPILIGCAALIALVGVLAFWVALDNILPEHPIASLLIGPTPTKTLPPRTAVATTGGPSTSIASILTSADQMVLQSQFDPAIQLYQMAAQLAPTNPTPLTRWSRALALSGRLADAVAKAHQATQRASGDAEAQAQLARVLLWNGQTDQALAAGEKAIQLDPKSANAHAFLSEIYLAVQRAPDAQKEAALALQIAPQNAESHRAQAWVLTLTGQKETALNEWRQAVVFEPNLFFRHFELAEVSRIYFGSPGDAVPEYQKAINLYGAYIPAHSHLGMALLDANQPQAAIAPLRRAITLDPTNAESSAYLGLAYGRAGNCSQAIPYFQQALQMDANNTVAAKGLSDCSSGKMPSAPASAPQQTPLIPPTLVPNVPPPTTAPTPGSKPYP